MRALIYIFILSLSFHTYAQSLCSFDRLSRESTLSKTIRSQVEHYWCSVKKYKWPKEVEGLIGYSGLLIGDTHIGNFSVIPVSYVSRRALEFLPNDFDDSGIGPFIFDFIRLVVTSRAIEVDTRKDLPGTELIRIKEAFEAYLTGLTSGGAVPSVPQRIEKDLLLGLEGYEVEKNSMIEARLSKKNPNRLSLDGDEAVPLPTGDPITKELLKPFLEGAEILDIIKIQKKRGGSVNEKRYWVLVKNKNQKKTIIEFKGWSKTSLSEYSPQKSPNLWSADVLKEFWPGEANKDLQFIKVKDDYFWQREKRKVLTDIPYEVKRPKDIVFIQQAILYTAYKLGQIHGRQTTSKLLKQKLKDLNDSDALLKAIQTFVSDYFKEIQS